jgi:DNA-directed RNA polymerase I, II, and III subunit RPABC2
MDKDPEEYSDDGANLSGTDDDDDSVSVNSQIEDDDVEDNVTKETDFIAKSPDFSPPSDDEEADVEEDEEDDEDSVVEGVDVDEDEEKTINQKNPLVDDSDEDNDDDEEDLDEHYLQKFNEDVTKNYILDFHPECKIHNYDEISALTMVIRDNHNNIIDDLHRTIPYLTKYEKARVLGQRAKQINTGAKAFVKVPDHVVDGYLIAELELMQKRVPFIIRRPIFGGGCEYWNLKDLEIIGF